jgi:hypothetical protein
MRPFGTPTSSFTPKYVDLAKYSKLAAFKHRCEARPAWKKALETGNGYDMNFPRQWDEHMRW